MQHNAKSAQDANLPHQKLFCINEYQAIALTYNAPSYTYILANLYILGGGNKSPIRIN